VWPSTNQGIVKRRLRGGIETFVGYFLNLRFPYSEWLSLGWLSAKLCGRGMILLTR